MPAIETRRGAALHMPSTPPTSSSKTCFHWRAFFAEAAMAQRFEHDGEDLVALGAER